MLQLEHMHRLGIAGGTEELRVHAEGQRADSHVPKDTVMRVVCGFVCVCVCVSWGGGAIFLAVIGREGGVRAW